MRVFITGISRGLGAGIARAALDAGAEVWGCSRKAPETLGEDGSERLHFCPVDLTEDSAAQTVRDWLEGIDGFDRVYLNAGMLPPIADLAETSLSTLRSTMEVNVWVNKWLLDVLFADDRELGQVIAISSGAAVSGQRGWNGYGISKAALNMLIKLTAVERTGTHFTALAPGLIDTAMQDAICGRKADERFPVVERLKQARGTETMPDARVAGQRCWDVAERLRAEPSGAFVDLRKLAPGH